MIFNIISRKKFPVELAISGSWENPQYVGSLPDTTGLSFTCIYNDGTSKPVNATLVTPSLWGSTSPQTATFQYTENGITLSATSSVVVIFYLLSNVPLEEGTSYWLANEAISAVRTRYSDNKAASVTSYFPSTSSTSRPYTMYVTDNTVSMGTATLRPGVDAITPDLVTPIVVSGPGEASVLSQAIVDPILSSVSGKIIIPSGTAVFPNTSVSFAFHKQEMHDLGMRIFYGAWNYEDIHVGNGKAFTACRGPETTLNDHCMYCISSDGINWTTGYVPGLYFPFTSYYFKGYYLIFTYKIRYWIGEQELRFTQNYAYSTDGINWTTGDYNDLPTGSGNQEAITYIADDSQVALGISTYGGHLYKSQDGITWSYDKDVTVQKDSSTIEIRGPICYDSTNKRFLAGSDESGYIFYTTDSTYSTWSICKPYFGSIGGGINGICCHNGIYAYVRGRYIYYGTSLEDSQASRILVSSDENYDWTTISYDEANSVWILSGAYRLSGDQGPGAMAFSVNLTSWYCQAYTSSTAGFLNSKILKGPVLLSNGNYLFGNYDYSILVPSNLLSTNISYNYSYYYNGLNFLDSDKTVNSLQYISDNTTISNKSLLLLNSSGNTIFDSADSTFYKFIGMKNNLTGVTLSSGTIDQISKSHFEIQKKDANYFGPYNDVSYINWNGNALEVRTTSHGNYTVAPTDYLKSLSLHINTTDSKITPTSLEISGTWSKYQYINNSVDPTGLIFTVHYSNETSATITPAYFTPLTWGETEGSQTATFYYTENRVTVNASKVASVVKKLESISISGFWNVEQHTETPPDTTGLTFTAHYNNGSTASITPIFSPSRWSAVAGNQTITFSYTDSGVTQTATSTVVVEPSIPYIRLLSSSPITLSTRNATKGWENTIEVSVDGNTWSVWDGTTAITGNKLYLRGSGNTKITGDTSTRWLLSSESDITIKGNLGTLLSYNNIPATLSTEKAFYYLFAANTALKDASQLILPFTTLSSLCYAGMFANSGLVYAPVLPARHLAYACYSEMFKGTSLISCPELPATDLAEHCYNTMFYNCRSLLSATNLPATTLASFCYAYMFQSCSSLLAGPETLPAQTLLPRCYKGMFSGCTSLTTAPNMQATSAAYQSCANMFLSCSSLTSLPFSSLASTVGEECYYGMFVNCTGLKSAPELPATTLANSCYQYMFNNCASLTSTPRLPALVLADSCYDSMFEGCTSLETLPILSGNPLKYFCYATMFQDCSKIKISTSQGGEYTTAYRVPSSGNSPSATNSTFFMFEGTGGSFTGTPSINTTYYTSNTTI